MKRTNKRKAAIALALASIPFLTGCGHGTNPAGVGGIPGSILGGGACIPINTTIPFAGNGVYFDYANLRGGQIPSGQSFGQMGVSVGVGGGPYQRSGVDGTISMNIMPLNQAAPTGYPGMYPTQPGYNGGPTTANVNGIVTIAPATQQDILYQFGGMMGQPAYNPYMPGTTPFPSAPAGQPCVSGIAMDVGHYNTTIYGGNVFLYLNNTQHGYALYF